MTGELDRARKREAATREILDLISLSRDDAGPVFDAILHRAADLCSAFAAALIMGKVGDTHQRLVAHYGVDPATIALYDRGEVSMNPDASFAAQAIATGKIVHIEDMMDTEFYRQGVGLHVSIVQDSGIRTEMQVPLLSPTGGIGTLAIFRREVRPYSADEIALVETFAVQAVIAIENVRQFRELQTRLEREKASAEILEVISHSRDDDRPVFDVILRNATRLCGADSAALLLGTPDGPHLTLAALKESNGLSRTELDQFIAGINAVPMRMDPGLHVSAQAICDCAVVHIADLSQTGGYLSGEPSFRFMVEDQGVRTTLSVPLFNADRSIGAISVHRREVRPYGNDEIALIQSFAAQAVIAIENVRQFRELQTRLAREAATREILTVISQSRDDERPVFDVVLRKSAELCGASMADLEIISQDRSHSVMVAHWGEVLRHHVVGTTSWPMDSELADALYMRDGRVVHVHDLADTDLYRSGDPMRVADVDKEGIRTFLAVPLFSNGRTVGCITLYRREVNPFSADDIALVETFAAQAVIAIENVRQFRELQTRLEREAATREILEVISQSRDNEQPIFEVVLRKSAHLCGASMASLNIVSEDRSQVVRMAKWGDQKSDQLPVGRTVWQMESGSAPAVCVREGRIEHLHDMADTDLYRSGDAKRVAAVDDLGIRTFLTVPLFSGGQTVGCISVYRHEVRPFASDEIALLEIFAAQAVIAIENVRQFRELQTRLERERAAADILELISKSRDDDRPVFDLIAQSAARLCGAAVCTFWRVEDGLIHYCASHGLYGDGLAEAERTPSGPLADNTMTGRVFSTRAVARIEDATAESYADHGWVRARGLKQLIGVPIFVGDGVWGCISLMWPADRAPREEDIQLVETFAAQAAIAIENVRQFKALERLNAELGDRVEAQVGEIDRMGRLKRFLPAAVADAVVSSGSEKLLSSHRALLGVLFCDIRGFTAFCETAEPEETIEVLQTYHEEMGKLINDHGAGVDHRMGDGIMVLFNDPLPCDDPAGEAVRLAIAMRARMAELSLRWKRLGHRLGFGVGISLGYATVGMVGFEGRFDYTASGTAVNLASRLCDEALDGEILLSPRASIAVEDRFPVQSRGEITLKGIREPVEVFRLAPIVAA